MPWTRDKTKTLRWALLVSLPVLAALPVYFLRDHVAEHTRSWRSAHNLSKARALGEENEWEESYRYALVARQLNPTSVEALRVLVEAALRARSPRTLDFASALFFNANASSDDKLLVLSILQKARDHIGFVRLYNLLPNELRTEPKFVVLRVQFLIDRNAYDSAKEMLESEIANRPDRQYMLLLASLLIQSGSDSADMARGQQLISDLLKSEESDEVARTAFQLLGFINPEEFRSDLLGDLGDRSAKFESDQPGDYIAAASLALAAAGTPEARQTILEKAIADQSKLAPTMLADWLARIDKSENILDFLTEERGRQSVDLYERRLVALVTNGRVEEAEAWLTEPPPGLKTIHIWLARARLAKVKDSRSEENNAWEQAFQVAQTSAGQNEYLRIFEVATNSDRLDIATRALLKAPSHPNGILPPAVDVAPSMKLLTQNDRLGDLKFLTEALVAREPENVVLLNNLAYLYLLEGEKIDAAVSMISELVQQNQGLLSLRTTHALGLLLQKKNQEALKTLPNEADAWKRASPADLAIRALSFERNGEKEMAEKIWALVDKSKLTKAEKRILLAQPDPPEAIPEDVATPSVSDIPAATN